MTLLYDTFYKTLHSLSTLSKQSVLTTISPTFSDPTLYLNFYFLLSVNLVVKYSTKQWGSMGWFIQCKGFEEGYITGQCVVSSLKMRQNVLRIVIVNSGQCSKIKGSWYRIQTGCNPAHTQGSEKCSLNTVYTIDFYDLHVCYSASEQQISLVVSLWLSPLAFV